MAGARLSRPQRPPRRPPALPGTDTDDLPPLLGTDVGFGVGGGGGPSGWHGLERALAAALQSARGGRGGGQRPRKRGGRSWPLASLSVKGMGWDEASPPRESARQERSPNSKLSNGRPQLVAATAVPPPPTLLRNVYEGMVAGAAAGVTVETALYPIDTIKTRLQVARSGGTINWKGLYSGLSGNLVGVLPASAIFVGVYEPLKQKLLKRLPENLSVVAHLTAGAAGGLAASLVRVPTEVVKQRMQTGQFQTAAAAVSGILANEGARGLYAGYNSFLLRDLPFDALQFAIYEQLKIGAKKLTKRELRDAELALIGAAAGAVTGAVTTPLDVIKTRLMTQGMSGQYKGIMDVIAKTSAEEGVGALFKGVGPRVMWIGIGGSIFFAVLERTKKMVARPPGLEPALESV